MSPIILLQNAQVLDAQTGAFLPNRRVVVREGLIERLEPMYTEAPEARAAEVVQIDLGGNTHFGSIVHFESLNDTTEMLFYSLRSA